MIRRALLLLGVQVCAFAPHQPASAAPAPTALTDGDPDTYAVLCQAPARENFDTSPDLVPTGPCDIDLAWPAPRTLGEVSVSYVTLHGVAYEPAAAGQALQVAEPDGAFQDLPAAIEIDYRAQGERAPLQGSGTARWTYRFAPITTRRLRLRLTQPRNQEVWHRLYAIRELRAGPPAKDAPAGRPAAPILRRVGAMPAPPPWPDGADLSGPSSGARWEQGGVVRWPRPVLVNRVEIDGAQTPAPAGPTEIAWWDGAAWRPVQGVEALPRGARFLPVATEGLRLRPLAQGKARLSLDEEAARYFREVEQSRTDALGARFRAAPVAGEGQDLAAMRALLLPLSFARAAIGRPADRDETHVAWNGTFFMVEDPAGGLWILSQAGQARHKVLPVRHDRWFALAAGTPPRLFGDTPDHGARTRYLDGWLPATVTTTEADGLRFTQTLFVTAETPRAPHGTVLIVDVENPAGGRRSTVLTLAMGRRRNLRFQRERKGPLSFAPERTGYALDPDGHTVRGTAGQVILWAESQGQWGGTDEERHLRYPLSIGPSGAPSGRTTLRFFLPHTAAPPIKDPPRGLSFAGMLADLRAFWTGLLARGMTLDLPEPGLNEIYRNLIAQALIITGDGPDEVKYGAYAYEMYFGGEEGWPAVALAQVGQGAEAQRLLSLMMGPELLDPGRHPSSAVAVYRLTRDRRWLAAIAPRLREAAEATLRALRPDQPDQPGQPGQMARRGILPRRIYGGDVDTPAHSFPENALRWRALHDTAWALRELGPGDAAQAEGMQREADAYRRRLLLLADELVDRSSDPPFLPVAFDIGEGAARRAREPTYAFLGRNVTARHLWEFLGNYWNIIAPASLEAGVFPAGDHREAWIPDFMEARGGVAAGLARFTLGADAIYGKGYAESLLRRGRREAFWTALAGMLAHGMSPDTYSFPEVGGIFPLRTSNRVMWREGQRALWSWGFQGWEHAEGDALSAGPGVALQLLRAALIREEEDGTLRLLSGAPRHWFLPGKRLIIRDAPTSFGAISLELEVPAGPGDVRARLRTRPGFSARRVLLDINRPGSGPGPGAPPRLLVP